MRVFQDRKVPIALLLKLQTNAILCVECIWKTEAFPGK